jgi:hypothetical protein
MYSGGRGTVTVMAPQWQLERIEVSVAAMLCRVVLFKLEYVGQSLTVWIEYPIVQDDIFPGTSSCNKMRRLRCRGVGHRERDASTSPKTAPADKVAYANHSPFGKRIAAGC